MTPRMINALIDPILLLDDIGWDQIDVLNDLYQLYPKQLEMYLLMSDKFKGRALIEKLMQYVKELQTANRSRDWILVASLNRVIDKLKGLVNF